MRALPLFPALVLTCALTVGGTGHGRAQTLSPAQKKKVEQMIEELDLSLTGGTEKNNSRALSTCQAALASTKATFQFFMDSTKELDFDQAGKREADWREWKTRNEDRYKSAEHIAARQYQLRFLVLTLQVMMAEDQKAALTKAVPELIGYYDGVAANFEKLEEYARVLREPVLESVFAEHLKLNITVRKDGSWIDAPLPLGAAYEQLILPHYRAQKDHQSLQAAWDKRIIQESKTMTGESAGRIGGPGQGFGPGPASFSGRRGFRDPREAEREERREDTRQKAVSEEEFKTKRLPELRWAKERDGLLFGPDAEAGYTALGRVLRDHLAHPQALKWLQELKTLAQGGWSGDKYYETSEQAR